MADERLKNPCCDCKRKRTCEKNGNYFRECLRYRVWISWNWEQAKARFYALKAKQDGVGVKKTGAAITPEVFHEIVETHRPEGRFWLKDGDKYIGVDNSTGDAWTEEFISLDTCLAWLLEEA